MFVSLTGTPPSSFISSLIHDVKTGRLASEEGWCIALPFESVNRLFIIILWGSVLARICLRFWTKEKAAASNKIPEPPFLLLTISLLLLSTMESVDLAHARNHQRLSIC